ncbi:proline dehydrogenase family protein [Candidatus Micrarchaeota archaeon]|nr:proline dehydrogenase family protein [Candidatus Micrarchaeota archaeon]
MTDGKLPFSANAIKKFGNFFFLNIMKQWVAGANAEDAIVLANKFKKAKHSDSIINHLGEHYVEKAVVDKTVEEYKSLISGISKSRVKAAVSIKPSQFGCNCKNCGKSAEVYCFKKIKELAEYAKPKGIFIWIDMESSQITDFTIATYKKLLPDYNNLGLCIQANLKRTARDLKDFIKLAGQGISPKLRLVKGAYPESPAIACQTEEEKHAAFKKLIETAFKESPKNVGIAVASFHEQRVQEALALQKKYPKDFFEIQVLKGVMQEFAESLRAKGLNVVEYIPYGKDAFAYSVRRAMKNPKFKNSILFKTFFDVYKKYYT